MRRLALVLALGGVGGLVVLCTAGLLGAWASNGFDLVLPGATNVQINGRGTPRLNITYDLPPNKRMNSLNQHFVSQGWRRVTLRDFERPNTTFVRTRLLGVVREIAIINTRPIQRRTAEISLARCVRIGSWVRCL